MPIRRHLPLVLIVLLVCAVYGNSFGNGFHFDDFHTVVDNPAIRSLGNLPRIATDATAFSVLPANRTFRPVVTASLAFDYALAHGYRPLFFHLSTFVWFLVLLGVLFRFVLHVLDRVERSPANRIAALLVAGWFGVHPAMAETVNYVIQRGDLYCTLGCLGALLLYARFPAWRRWGLYLLPFALAMLSKPPAVVFMGLLCAYVGLFEANGEPLARRLRKGARAALPAAVLTLALLALEAALTPKSYAPTTLSGTAYRLTQPYVWLRYFGALFLPLHLNVDTDLQAFPGWNRRALAGFAFMAALAGAAAYSARRKRLRPIAFGLLWFGLAELPTSVYALSEVENDHRMFFAFPGLMLSVVWACRLGFGRLRQALPQAGQQRWLRPAATATAVLVLGAYALGAHRRNAVWHDEASLWADDVAKSPGNGRGLMIYGLTRMDAGDATDALVYIERALHYTPNYPTLEINLGVAHGMVGDATGDPGQARVAERHFRRAVSLAPGDDLPHAFFGRWLLQHGRVPEAVGELQTAVGLNGERPLQRDLLLLGYVQTGNAVAARALAQTALAADGTDATALAVLRTPAGTVASAQAAALVDVSLAAYRAGRFQRSIEAAQAALQADPHSAEAWNNVGAGYGALGQWGAGIAAEKQALELNPHLAIAANNLRWFLMRQAADPRGAWQR